MEKRFSEFTEGEKNIICQKNREYAVFPDWEYAVAEDMDMGGLRDYVLDFEDDDSAPYGKVVIIDYIGGADIAEVEKRLNDGCREYYEYLTDPAIVYGHLFDNDPMVDAETYEVRA